MSVHKLIVSRTQPKTHNQTFIGIDPALTKLGFCILTAKTAELFLLKTGKRRGCERLVFINDYIETLFTQYTSAHSACVEAGSYGSGGRLFNLGEACGVCRIQVARVVGAANVVSVSPTRLKKFFTGKGNAKKSDMLATANKCVEGAQIKKDDLADAYALASLAEQLHITSPSTRAQAEVICDLLEDR